MVIKFDHVSYSCSIIDRNSYPLDNTYYEVFREENLMNAPCKAELLRYGAETHDIIMYHSKEGNLPIEVTRYPEIIDSMSNMNVYHNVVEFLVRDVPAAMRFFECFDMAVKEQDSHSALLQVVTALDENLIYIKLVEQELQNCKACLDKKGFSSIALFVDNVEKYLNKARKEGFSATEISSVLVNKKFLSVGFSIGGNGEIVELVSLDKGEIKNAHN